MLKQTILVCLVAVLLFQQVSAYVCRNGTLLGDNCYCDSGFIYQGSIQENDACVTLTGERKPVSEGPPAVSSFSVDIYDPSIIRLNTNYRYPYEGRKNYQASFNNGQCTSPRVNMTAGYLYTKNVYNFNGEESLGFTFPLKEILQCGFAVTQDSTMKRYKGVFEISYTDTLDRGLTKRSTDAFPLAFAFPKSIAVSNNLQVQKTEGGVGNLDLNARVTAQSVKLETSEMTLTLTTQVNYPAVLSSIAAVEMPVNVGTQNNVTNVTLLSQDCQVGAVCTQVWRITYYLKWDTCSFTGAYQYSLALACHGAFGGSCPYIGQFVNVTDSLHAETLCYNRDITVSASGSLSFHADSSFTSVKTSFSSETGYAKASITTTPAGPASLSFIDVVVNKQYSGQNVFLVSAGAVTAAGTTANFGQIRYVVSGYSGELGFSFTPSAFIESNNPSLYQTFTISATVQLNFAGGAQRTALVEMKVQQQSQVSTKVSAQLDVARGKVTSSASILSASLYLISLLAALVVAAF